MTEQNTEPTEEMNEPIEVVTPEPTPIKSKKARSELQLKALANARQAAYKIRAEQAVIKKQNKGKQTPEVSIEFQKIYPDVSKDDSKDVSKDDPAEIRDDSKDVLPENENDIIEKIPENVKETEPIKDVNQESAQEREDFINNLIDERVQYKPIVKSKFKLVDGMYILRD